MQLDERKKRILRAIIDDYVRTASPVGSRTISGKYMLGLSSATIRNEMSDLTELGYLEQPHVSAGRVPNAKAYRLYVDSLHEAEPMPAAQAERIRRDLMGRVKQVNDVVNSMAEALSELTQYPSVVMMPKQEELRINSLHLVPISRASALIVVVTDGGIIRDAMLHVSDMLDHDGLYAISRMLSDRLRGQTLHEAQKLLKSFSRQAPLDPQVLGGIADLAAQLERQSASDSLRVAGSHNMLRYPEYADVNKARDMMSALDQTDSLLGLLKADADGGLSVRIGPENGLPRMADLSIVTCSYEMGRGHRGAIGVIGPTRMPYREVLDTLSVAGRTLSQILITPNDE